MKTQDIRWITFILWFLAIAAINAIARHYIMPTGAPPVEEAFFYGGFAIGHFLFAFILVAPFHFIGKRRGNPYDSPKKLIAIWATVISAVMLIAAAFMK